MARHPSTAQASRCRRPEGGPRPPAICYRHPQCGSGRRGAAREVYMAAGPEGPGPTCASERTLRALEDQYVFKRVRPPGMRDGIRPIRLPRNGAGLPRPLPEFALGKPAVRLQRGGYHVLAGCRDKRSPYQQAQAALSGSFRQRE